MFAAVKNAVSLNSLSLARVVCTYFPFLIVVRGVIEVGLSLAEPSNSLRFAAHTFVVVVAVVVIALLVVAALFVLGRLISHILTLIPLES